MVKSATRQQQKILIADDEPAMAQSLTFVLKREGYAVTTVGDGQAVLNAVKHESFAIIILDVIMPILDGWGVLAQLQAQACTIPIVVASNLGQESDILKAKAFGAADFFVKSDVPLAEIVRKINTLVHHEHHDHSV